MATLLMIDDDYTDYLFIKDSLEESFGSKLIFEYKQSYEEALDYFIENQDRVDLLIIDYDLGAKKGDELYQELKKSREVPTVFLTGNLDPQITENLKELAVLAVINKDAVEIQSLIKLVSTNLTLERDRNADI